MRCRNRHLLAPQPVVFSLLQTQTPPAALPSKCRQIDFWVGEWDTAVQPTVRKAGENSVTRAPGRRVLFENWRGVSPVTGSGVNASDVAIRRWPQCWVDGGGGVFALPGGKTWRTAFDGLYRRKTSSFIRMKTWLLGLCSIVLFWGPVDAQNRSAPPPSPTAVNHEFDFWLGDWEVFGTDGKKLGDSLLVSVADGHGLLENWTPVDGAPGKALHSYDEPTRHWRQFWVGSSGILELAGGFSGGCMRLAGARTESTGRTTHFEIRWTPGTDDTVRQTMQISTDGRITWQSAFDGIYRRRGQR